MNSVSISKTDTNQAGALVIEIRLRKFDSSKCLSLTMGVRSMGQIKPNHSPKKTKFTHSLLPRF